MSTPQRLPFPPVPKPTQELVENKMSVTGALSQSALAGSGGDAGRMPCRGWAEKTKPPPAGSPVSHCCVYLPRAAPPGPHALQSLLQGVLGFAWQAAGDSLAQMVI